MMMTSQVLKVRTRYVGSRDDLGGIVSTLADTLTRRGARSFRRSVIAAAEGDFTQGWSGVNIGIEELQGIYAEAFRRGGLAESTVLRGFEIDMSHPRVRSHLRRRSADLVTGIDNETRIALRRGLAEGTIEGLRPEELATRIRGIIGLSPRDAQAVDNLRAGMRAQGVPAGTANRRAREYADRLLDARALIIARTEVTDAIETGRQELWEQAVEAGLLAREHIWRIWVTFEDERVCPICRPLDGARARLGGVFNKGGQTSPRPPAHPNCRCSVDYEIAQFRIRKHGGSSHDQKDHGNWARGGRKGQPQYANEGFPKQVSEVSAKAFHSGFVQARKGKHGAFLSDFDQGHFEQTNIRTLTAFDGKVGAALIEHDDGRVEVGSLFALPGSPDGSGRDLLRYLIHERGGNWLNNFDGVLTEFYIAEGFKVLTREPWSDEFAPQHWKYDEFGRPDYVTMGTKAVKKYDTRGRGPGQEGLLGAAEEAERREVRRREFRVSGGRVGDGQGVRVDRPEGGSVDKHYGPGPHPGTGTPQKIHGQPAGSEAIGISEDDFVSDVGPAVRPFLFSFETKSGATYHSVITKISDDFSDDRVIIEGEIQADNDEFIGKFQREIDLFDMTVQNLSFKVDPKFQAEGIGLTWLTLVENGLHREGIERMFVQAVDVGRYAWAKHGYDWDGNEGAFWWASMKDYKPHGNATIQSKERWSELLTTYEGGDHIPEPWEIASIPGLGKRVLFEGPTWNGVKDTTIDYEAVAKADSVAYNRLLHQWVADGKAGLIESDDPSWFEAVAQLR